MPSTINASSTGAGGLVSSADASGILQLQTNGTATVTVDTSGNMGVGTATPSVKLHVEGGNARINRASNTTILTLGGSPSDNWEGDIQFVTSNNQINWRLASNRTTSGSFTITPSTAGGGSTFTTPAVTIDNASNLGLGVTPSAWGSSFKAFQVGAAGCVASQTSAKTIEIANNAYNNSGWKYQASDVATLYYQYAGKHTWANAVSGTAGNAITFTETMTLDASGNLGVGTTSPTSVSNYKGITLNGTTGGLVDIASNGTVGLRLQCDTGYPGGALFTLTNQPMVFGTNGTERARIDSSGNLLVGTTNTNPGGADINGIAIRPGNFTVISALGTTPFGINRGTDDGILINLSQAGTTEGTISVSGTTVSYNGGHLSRYAQTTAPKDNSIFKGTVLSNLDEMNVYTKDGQPVANEQLNKVKVSDTEGDANVAGVFVNWSHDEDHNVDEINMAMTGDMIIRIAQGVTVVRGDLLMSAGDGTAKPQGDDIIRSKTVAKVTSNHVTCTYADGSYCVPCVLMAC